CPSRFLSRLPLPLRFEGGLSIPQIPSLLLSRESLFDTNILRRFRFSLWTRLVPSESGLCQSAIASLLRRRFAERCGLERRKLLLSWFVTDRPERKQSLLKKEAKSKWTERRSQFWSVVQRALEIPPINQNIFLKLKIDDTWRA